MSGFEENEISKNANGGTEIAKRRLQELLDPALLENFQIISSRIRELESDKIRILYCHDLPSDPESAKLKDEAYRNQFHKLVFISDWQYEQYRMVLGIPYSDHSVVIESGIDPIVLDVEEAKKDKPIRCVYTSTPQRGLNIFYAVFEKLAQEYDDIHCDVFSSFKLYGWQDDPKFEELFNAIKNHKSMTYHGAVPNQELKDYLKKCHIFAYPCTWPETSCRAMLEAMSAGLLCIHPNYGALPLSSGYLNMMYAGDQDLSKHAGIFYNVAKQGIEMVRNADKHYWYRVKYNKGYVDTRYNIERVRMQWESLLTDLLRAHPDFKSREVKKAPAKVFNYRTVQQ
jgi:UDP-glucose:(glucosyl)LPS alpha-1,2-glucosyltransferase